MTDIPKLEVKCTAGDDNTIELEIGEEGQTATHFRLTSDVAVTLAAALLGATRTAGDKAGISDQTREGETIGRTITVLPNSLGVLHNPSNAMTAIVLLVGSEKIGIHVSAGQVPILAKTLSDISSGKAG
jgi:hypothetical protein